MLDCISVENMRLSDAMTIEKYVPSLELMHRAAMGVFQAVDWQGRIAIVVGSGNNGGDGFALACILCRENIDCAVFTVSQRLSADSTHYAAKAAELGVPITPFAPGCLDGFDMVVDCLLGTGFQGALRENYRTAIEEINASNAQVISVDINSGMNGDTGEGELIVRSDLTVTIGFIKNGLVTPNAGRHMKRLICADIGIRLAKEENKICTIDEHHPNAIPCPSWLDMTVIKAFSETL
jgi:NAD(P)H-hydrate epimerase